MVRGYLGEIARLTDTLAASGGLFEAIGSRLDDGQGALRQATEWLLGRDDLNDVLAGATPYLRMFGTVAGGYYTARMALEAAGRMEATAGPNGSDPWLQSKIDVAAFYAEQIVPQARGLMPAVVAGAGSLFAVDVETLGVTR